MIPLCSRFDSVLFTPKMSAIASYGNYSRSPLNISAVVAKGIPELKEQHFTILYGDSGYSYETIMAPYLRGARAVVIEDPYIRLQHQIQNFVRFCETVLKVGTAKKIILITGYDDNAQLAEIAEKLEELKQSLLELDVELEVKLNPNMHDREIRLDNGWIIKIGRGLDFYQATIEIDIGPAGL
jgi:ATP-dependent Lon protease